MLPKFSTVIFVERLFVSNFHFDSRFIMILLSLQETYPHSPPVWFAESEETNISNAIQLLSNTSGLDNHVINQVSTTLNSDDASFHHCHRHHHHVSTYVYS